MFARLRMRSALAKFDGRRRTVVAAKSKPPGPEIERHRANRNIARPPEMCRHLSNSSAGRGGRATAEIRGKTTWREPTLSHDAAQKNPLRRR